MNKSILILALLFTSSIIHCQELKSNASYIKSNYSADYETTVKKHAVEKWNDDYSMIVYEINKQADALVNLIKEFETENTNIVFKAMLKWSIEGYESNNTSKINELKTFGLEQLITFDCDWSMVSYEYKKQVKAKSSF